MIRFRISPDNEKVYREVERLTSKEKHLALIDKSLVDTSYQVRKDLQKHLSRNLNIKRKNYLNLVKFEVRDYRASLYFDDAHLRKQQDAPVTLSPAPGKAYIVPDGRLKNVANKGRETPLAITKRVAADKKRVVARSKKLGSKKRKKKITKAVRPKTTPYFVIRPYGRLADLLGSVPRITKRSSTPRKSSSNKRGIALIPGIYENRGGGVRRLYRFIRKAPYVEKRIDFEGLGRDIFAKRFVRLYYKNAKNILGVDLK